MEFREYYRGVCARIRFDSATGMFIAEIDGLPDVSLVKGETYDDIRSALKQSVDDHLAGRNAKLASDWSPRAGMLDQGKIGREAAELEEALSRIASELV